MLHKPTCRILYRDIKELFHIQGNLMFIISLSNVDLCDYLFRQSTFTQELIASNLVIQSSLAIEVQLILG